MSVDEVAEANATTATAESEPAGWTPPVYIGIQRLGYSMCSPEMDPMSLVDHMSVKVDGVHPGERPYHQPPGDLCQHPYRTANPVARGEIPPEELLETLQQATSGVSTIERVYNPPCASYN